MEVYRDVRQEMNLNTESGIHVKTIDCMETRVLTFSKPVRAIELTKEEASRIGASLLRQVQTGTTATVRDIIASDFFTQKRTFGEIREEVASKGLSVEPAPLNVILSKMVRKNELKREGDRRFYKYYQSL